jgi:8-oxo-dGTP pyrophosphatase MutT (NUDIX family)
MAYDYKDHFLVVPAVFAVLRRGDEIFMIRRANTGYADGKLSLPAGHIDGGEPAIAAAAREAYEEAGVKIDPKDFRLIHTHHRIAEEGDHERIDLFFETTKWEGEPRNAEPEKCSEVLWVNKNNIPKDTIPMVANCLRHINASEPYSHENFPE